MAHIPSLAEMAALQGDRDVGDRDLGDYDSTEVDTTVPNVWHPSHQLKKPEACASKPTEAGRQALEQVRSLIQRHQAPPEPPKPSRKSSWYATPLGLRRLIAKAANLDGSVADKMDIQLTESEKAALRGAALRLKLIVEPLTEI